MKGLQDLQVTSTGKLDEILFKQELTEDMALLIAENRNTPPESLELLARSVRFKDSYRIKLALCKNPKTPQRIVLSLLKFLRLFDLADLTRNPNIHINIKQKVEQLIKEKIPALPIGNRITLAKRSSSTVVLAILEKAKGGREVSVLINTCLENPFLKEGDILKLINSEITPPEVIKSIAVHPRWSFRYSVRYALIRNFYTPLHIVVEFLKDMKLQDLEDLYKDEVVPSSTKPFIYRELTERWQEEEQ
ncbi:MAG: hypothetical protein N2257_05105 [Thermodesulfovibrionales bacterium]|nr:hypothetical protein [Thermodesulfovibrionales bacterium]